MFKQASDWQIEQWNSDRDFGKWQWKMKVVLTGNRYHPILYAPKDLDLDISASELIKIQQWALNQ